MGTADLAILHSLGVRYDAVGHRGMRFRVSDEGRTYRSEEMEGDWFVVLYDGSSEPRATYRVEVRESLSLYERGTR